MCALQGEEEERRVFVRGVHAEFLAFVGEFVKS